jgi:TM2 domain-containing membrane protein YozV
MTEPKSPGLAVGLSMIIPGAGHLYLDRVGQGVAIILINAVAWLVTLMLLLGGIGAGFLLVALIWIGSVKSAHKAARLPRGF